MCRPHNMPGPAGPATTKSVAAAVNYYGHGVTPLNDRTYRSMIAAMLASKPSGNDNEEQIFITLAEEKLRMTELWAGPTRGVPQAKYSGEPLIAQETKMDGYIPYRIDDADFKKPAARQSDRDRRSRLAAMLASKPSGQTMMTDAVLAL